MAQGTARDAFRRSVPRWLNEDYHAPDEGSRFSPYDRVLGLSRLAAAAVH